MCLKFLGSMHTNSEQRTALAANRRWMFSLMGSRMTLWTLILKSASASGRGSSCASSPGMAFFFFFTRFSGRADSTTASQSLCSFSWAFAHCTNTAAALFTPSKSLENVIKFFSAPSTRRWAAIKSILVACRYFERGVVSSNILRKLCPTRIVSESFQKRLTVPSGSGSCLVVE